MLLTADTMNGLLAKLAYYIFVKNHTFNMFSFKADNGGLGFAPITKERFKEYLLSHEGDTFDIIPRKKKRSLTQNNYYWFYLEVVERETGNVAVELHEYFKRTLLPPKFITVMGKELKIPASTTELSKLDFGEYLDKICAETNVPLPDPEAAGYFK